MPDLAACSLPDTEPSDYHLFQMCVKFIPKPYLYHFIFIIYWQFFERVTDPKCGKVQIFGKAWHSICFVLLCHHWLSLHIDSDSIMAVVVTLDLSVSFWLSSCYERSVEHNAIDISWRTALNWAVPYKVQSQSLDFPVIRCHYHILMY